MCSLFGCRPQNEGQLKYPDIDEDKTRILRKQVDGLVRNVKKVFSFTFSFERTPEEELDAEIREAHQQKLEKARTSGYLEVFEPYPRKFKATFKLSVRRALQILNESGITLDFQVHRTYLAKTKRGTKVVNFPKRPTTDPPLTPRAGVEQKIVVPEFTSLKDRPRVLKVDPQTVPVMFSHEFDIAESDLPGWSANREDYLEVRLAIWHELMELTIIAITVEALYWPPDLYFNHYINDTADNFADDVVEHYERFFIDRDQFLYWDDEDEDPPFDSFEAGAYTRETEAERLEGNAISRERQDNWAAARERWIEARYLLHRGGCTKGRTGGQKGRYPLRTNPYHTLDNPPPIATIVYKEV